MTLKNRLRAKHVTDATGTGSGGFVWGSQRQAAKTLSGGILCGARFPPPPTIDPTFSHSTAGALLPAPHLSPLSPPVTWASFLSSAISALTPSSSLPSTFSALVFRSVASSSQSTYRTALVSLRQCLAGTHAQPIGLYHLSHRHLSPFARRWPPLLSGTFGPGSPYAVRHCPRVPSPRLSAPLAGSSRYSTLIIPTFQTNIRSHPSASSASLPCARLVRQYPTVKRWRMWAGFSSSSTAAIA